MEAGRLDAAQESLDTAFAAVPAGSDFFADLARTLARCRAQLALLRGRAAEGDAQLQALLPQLGWGTAKPAGGLVAALPLAARAALAVGDAARARTLAEAALKIAQERARGPELSAWVGRA